MNTWFFGATNPKKALGGADYMWGVKKEKKSHMENLNLNN